MSVVVGRGPDMVGLGCRGWALVGGPRSHVRFNIIRLGMRNEPLTGSKCDLSAKSSLILGEIKAAFCKEGTVFSGKL